MSISEYIDKLGEVYKSLLDYIETEENPDENFHILLKMIEDQNIQSSKHELKILFNLISSVVNNHHHEQDFFDRIFKLISNLQKDLQNNFTQTEIFDLFKENKRIILYFIDEKILTKDDSLMDQIIQFNDSKLNYFGYFYQEYSENDQESFKEKQKIGENDSYICSLIRQDSVEDFISHITKLNISVSSKINPSIFETNTFLIDRSPSLIEYASFYGSIQIFQYLLRNNVELRPELWLYTIHGKNAEMIHILEENKVEAPLNNFIECLKESIKCHHNDIANYFLNTYLDSPKSCINEIISNFNFSFFNQDLINDSFFFYLCENGYFNLVKLLLIEGQININAITILNFVILNENIFFF